MAETDAHKKMRELAAELGRATRREMERIACEAGATTQEEIDRLCRVEIYIGTLQGGLRKYGG